MEFSWILKKYGVEIPGVNWKRSGVSTIDQEKIMLNFINLHFWPWNFQVSKGCNTISGNLQAIISKGKETKLKISVFFFQKSMPSNPSVYTFSEVVQ